MSAATSRSAPVVVTMSRALPVTAFAMPDAAPTRRPCRVRNCAGPQPIVPGSRMTSTTLASLGGMTVVLLVMAAFAAGWVDAVVGGGGLIQLPVLLLVPGMQTVQALATNKLSSAMGTATSSVTYYRRVRPGLATALPTAVVAAGGSACGALSAAAVPDGVLEPVILVALVAVAAYTVLRPAVGGVTELRFSGHRHTVIAALT